MFGWIRKGWRARGSIFLFFVFLIVFISLFLSKEEWVGMFHTPQNGFEALVFPWLAFILMIAVVVVCLRLNAYTMKRRERRGFSNAGRGGY